MPKSKQELTRRAGRMLAEVVQAAEHVGPGRVPGPMLRASTEASNAAIAAGATGPEVRLAAGVTSRQLADLFAGQVAELLSR